MADPSQSPIKRWKLEDAKAHFSELVRQARERGPQRVTVRRRDAIVVVAAEEFDRLMALAERRTLHDLLANSPLAALDFDEEGVTGPVREVDL